MYVNAVIKETKNLHQAISAGTPPAEAMQEILNVPQRPGTANLRWFQSHNRELMTGDIGGRWAWVEYTFPWGSETLVLRWRDGEPPRLWKLNTSVQRTVLSTQQEVLQPVEGKGYPLQELEQMEIAMQHLPHSLWARMLKLALALNRGPD